MGEPGTLRFDVLRDPATEEAFYVYEVYKNAAAFKEHQNNAPYKRWDSPRFQANVVAESWKLWKGSRYACAGRRRKWTN
jgi:quinol monooxygenase YgiN